MRIFRRPAPAKITKPVPSKPKVPGSGTVDVPPPPPPLLLPQPPPMVLLSNVTAPFRAKALPQPMVAPVFKVMLVSARIFPWNEVVVPRVAELPTCQNMFGSVLGLLVRLLIKTTDELLAVVSVLPIWKTNSEPGMPLSVSVPVSWAGPAKKYTPAISVCPPKFCPVNVPVRVKPAAAL